MAGPPAESAVYCTSTWPAAARDAGSLAKSGSKGPPVPSASDGALPADPPAPRTGRGRWRRHRPRRPAARRLALGPLLLAATRACVGAARAAPCWAYEGAGATDAGSARAFPGGGATRTVTSSSSGATGWFPQVGGSVRRGGSGPAVAVSRSAAALRGLRCRTACKAEAGERHEHDRRRKSSDMDTVACRRPASRRQAIVQLLPRAGHGSSSSSSLSGRIRSCGASSRVIGSSYAAPSSSIR